MSLALVWFRRDLRLADNPALDAARRGGSHVLPVYVHAPDEEAPWQPGAASRWWLHHSLVALDAELRRRGSRLHVAQGPTLAALQEIVAATGAVAVHWNRVYEPAFEKRDAEVKRVLRGDGIDAHSHKAAVWFEPWEVLTAQDEPYRVFTPYWRKARTQLAPRPPLPAPARIEGPIPDAGLAIEALALRPTIAWDAGLAETWTPGEHGAQEALADFLAGPLADYATQRDRPDLEGTSRLSPHLHFGEISPTQVAWAIEERRRKGRTNLQDGAESFLRELGWREFSQQLLHHFPRMPERNLDARFNGFRWARTDRVALRRWQQGHTGIPIVDAGMRELWTTGTMHNRVRMLVASFLTKNLRQHWRHGARWFWDTLVDADLANNSQGWQWTAGCGVDASPYFRIFNPVTQGEKFDPHGHYVRRWVPELADAPAALVHAPWRDPAWRA
ncbi:MAG: deoxyribodipyrimidine photo-lyase, partial [Xanthomonadales bacterium]|nr:deoxyribodipyrimidine photo-lyase [Xanthomonadales bacterium]